MRAISSEHTVCLFPFQGSIKNVRLVPPFEQSKHPSFNVVLSRLKSAMWKNKSKARDDDDALEPLPGWCRPNREIGNEDFSCSFSLSRKNTPHLFIRSVSQKIRLSAFALPVDNEGEKISPPCGL